MNIPIVTFNKGEVTPLVDARVDTEMYQAACRHLENMIPRIYGAAERRPGLKYITTRYGTAQSPVRMVSFIYSSEIAYKIEFGNLYARFFYDDAVVETITSPYAAADLFQLQFGQVGDVMWITHPSYPQYKLTRTTATTFSLDVIPFKKGPFLLRNDLVDPDETDTALMIIATGPALSTVGTGNDSQFVSVTAKAQTFIPPYKTKCSSVKVQLWKQAAYTGTFTLEIATVANNAPNNWYHDYQIVTIATATLDSALVTDTSQFGTLYEFTFDDSVTLYPNQTYAIIVSATYDGSDYCFWDTCLKVDSYGGSYGGFSYHEDGSYWSRQTDSKNMIYQLFGLVTVIGGLGYTGTMTCQDSDETAINFFEDGHVGSLFKLTYPRTTKISKCTLPKSKYTEPTIVIDVDEPYVICAAIDVKGSFRFVTHGLWDGTIELQRNENGAEWETTEIWVGEHDTNAQVAKVEDADNVQYRAVLTEFASGQWSDRLQYIRADITVQNDTEDVIVKVTAINSESKAAIVILSGAVIAGATRRWAEGAWSEKQGFPTTIGFFEGRCVYGGMAIMPIQITPDYDIDAENYSPKLLKVWFSHSDDYENFEAGVNAADSFEIAIATSEDIAWVKGTENLLVATFVDVWKIQSNKMEQALTPTNAAPKYQFGFGGNGVQPVDAGVALLYTNGQRLLELTFDGAADKFNAPNLSALAEHLTANASIVDMALQSAPDCILWCVLDTGDVIILVYEREQNCVGWAKVPIDGGVQSVCVTPGEYEDIVTLAIFRIISGDAIVSGSDTVTSDGNRVTNFQYNIYIEKFTSRTFADIENCFFVDCGITYEGDATLTITGLDHLDGETVKVLGNGVVFDDVIVSLGQITTKLAGVTTTVTKAQVGLAYTSKLMPMKPVVNTQMGSSAASIVSCKEMGISFLNTMGAKYGTSDDNLMDINFDDPRWENSSEISDLFTGTVAVSVDGGFSIDNNLIISSDSPLPCTVRALIPKVEVTGR